MAPQSTYVSVEDSGLCYWEPFVPWSVSHCAVDGTWFPFDEHYCELIYESWKYKAQEINLRHDSYFCDNKSSSIQEYDFLPNDLWQLVGIDVLHRCSPPL